MGLSSFGYHRRSVKNNAHWGMTMINHARATKSLIAFIVTLCSAAVIADDHDEALNLTSISPIHSTNFGIDQGEIEEIKRAMQTAVDGEFLPGALLLVGNSEGVGVLESVGMQGPDDNTPVNKDTIFRIYSMTKPIISVAIMTMVEDGLINLHDPLEKYIPEFGNLQVMDQNTGATRPAESSITIENLLTHESGIIQEIFSRDSDLGKMYASELQGDNTAQDFAARLGQLPVHFEPGTAWHYGHSTDVLGAVLEVAGDKTLDLILQERIFDPLGMDETSFWVPVTKKYRIAEAIHGAGMANYTVPRKMLSGGGGLNSTTEDYVRFAEMLLNGGIYRGNRIIEESTLAQMREKKIGDDVSREFFFYGNTGDWGLGFHLQPTTENANGPHNFGWRGIGGTFFAVDEENDFFMIYMEQKRGGPPSPFSANVAQRMVYEAMLN
ncbi:MAG: serine hydrolase [Pseudomonadales bacterium]|nr:serine hydrolase [Pseudomonadales bacterium]